MTEYSEKVKTAGMKNNFAHLIMVLALLLVANAGYCQSTSGSCVALLDNKSIELSDLKPITASVSEPAIITDGSAKTVVNLAVAGKGGETIKLGLALTEPLSPGSVSSNVLLYRNGATYTMEKGNSNVEVTDLIWSRDRKSFIISVNFNCTMHSTVFPEDGKRTLNLKGKVLRVKVMVPGAPSASN